MQKTLSADLSASKQIEKLDLLSWQSLNNSFRRRMVCRIGIDCGFFVEMNYMVNAMLYCLANRIRFQLYSETANFGTGVGWTEYFMPFCEEVHESFHRRYNFHRLPSWRRILKMCIKQKSPSPIVWKIKSSLKTGIGRFVALSVYKEYILFTQDVTINPDKQYTIPELGISCDYTTVYGLLARMIWRPRPMILNMVSILTDKLNLPSIYDGIHIRGGDKISESKLISGVSMMQLFDNKENRCVFVLTDDFRQYRELQETHPGFRFLTLCQTEECGYVHKDFLKESPARRREAIIRLIISVNILLGARSFVGSITTGPSVFIMKLRIDDPLVRAVDCPRELLASTLSMTISERAAISKKHLQHL